MYVYTQQCVCCDIMLACGIYCDTICFHGAPSELFTRSAQFCLFFNTVTLHVFSPVTVTDTHTLTHIVHMSVKQHLIPAKRVTVDFQ